MLHIAPEMITADQVIKLGFIESWGRGILKIQHGLRNAKLPPPIFEAKMGGVLVTIFRENTALETTQKIIQKNTSALPPKKQEILNYLSKNPSASRKELSENILGISEDGVKHNLKGLLQKGIIKRVGPDKGGHWEEVKRQPVCNSNYIKKTDLGHI